MSDFSVTVCVVSDYRGGEQKAWDDLRETLVALAHQDYNHPVEYLLLENNISLKQMPEQVLSALPGVRVIGCEPHGSYDMKNIGVRAAAGELVMILDADCVPERGWVRAGVKAMRERPDGVAISGRTTYPFRTTLERALGLLSRSYVDRGQAGPVRLLSTNNMIARREILCAYPFPEVAGPFAYRLVTERWVREGRKLYFEPSMNVVHDFEGWPMERDMRRQVGWTSMRIRQLDSTIPGASLVRRLGLISVPMLYAYRVVESIGRSFRLPRYFGLRWWHIPYLVGLAVLVHGLEIPGMLRALWDQEVGPTVYR